ncbi:hypothetical protein ACFWMR_01795 [Amycolatopsis thailandensis]|uniref:hypothetical protein n=1 Tax=Amycolatopsis thailandensis TaxID=589330 RepID=UPI00365095EB
MSEQKEDTTAEVEIDAAGNQVERHPADPRFNPAHPTNPAWRSGPPSPDMPAEAGIVAMFQAPDGPISASDVHVEPPPPGPESEVEQAESPEDAVDDASTAKARRRRS